MTRRSSTKVFIGAEFSPNELRKFFFTCEIYCVTVVDVFFIVLTLEFRHQKVCTTCLVLNGLFGFFRHLVLTFNLTRIVFDLCAAVRPQDRGYAACLCRSQFGAVPHGAVVVFVAPSSLWLGFSLSLRSVLVEFFACCAAG